MIFLKKVQQHSKYLFSAMLLFAAAQLFFFGRGITCSPWYNSGMFSEVIKPTTTYEVYPITPRHNALVCWLSPQRDDKVFVTLDQYYGLGNRHVYDQLVRVYQMAGLSRPDYNALVHSVNSNDFCRWFIPYAEAWINLNDSDCLKLQPIQANWDGRLLHITKK